MVYAVWYGLCLERIASTYATCDARRVSGLSSLAWRQESFVDATVITYHHLHHHHSDQSKQLLSHAYLGSSM